MMSQEKESKSDNFLLLVPSLFPESMQTLFTIILGFYSHIQSSLGTVIE